MNSRKQFILDYAIVTMIAGMFLSTVSSQKIPSLLFYVLVAASCLNWYVHYKKGTSTAGIEIKQHKTLFLLCSVSLVAVLISKAVHLNMSGTEIEKAVRFSIGLPLLYAGLRFIPYERLKHALWGVYAAIVFQFGYVIYHLGPNLSRPDTSNIHNAVSFGVMCLLFLLLVIFSFGLNLTKKNKFEQVLKLLILFLGIITFLFLRVRTGMVAMPILIFVVLLFFMYGTSKRKVLVVYLLSLSVIVATLMSIPSIQSRTKFAFREFNACLNSQISIDSSVCTRLQLLKASVMIWSEEPWFGTGDNSKFQEKLKNEYSKTGIVTVSTAKNFGEPHNDYAQNLSSFGVLGLLGVLFVYFAPAIFFLKRLIVKSTVQQRAVAGMGACVSLGFAVFSLTELMFRNMRTISFYTVLIAMLLTMYISLSRNNQSYTEDKK